MSLESGLQSRPHLSALRTPCGPLVPVLIEVPALRPTRARPGHSRHAAGFRPRRRRLRREVRVAGYTLLTAMPLALAWALLFGGRSTALFGSVGGAAPAARANADIAANYRPPVISISIEPAGMTTPVEAEPPVVFPGYLLPDDGSEEQAHAGS